jgi:PadR family transcriptional regulator PadR
VRGQSPPGLVHGGRGRVRADRRNLLGPGWTAVLPYVRILVMPLEGASELRVTLAVAQLLAEFLADASQPRYGYELMQATGFPSGKLYPIMGRLTRAGWLAREQEDIDPAQEGRPARYLYRLTEHGTRMAQQELAALRQKLASPAYGSVRPRPAGRPI